ncbi:MAG: FG-GAP repeat domain-containing protein [Mariniblastus sp.]
MIRLRIPNPLLYCLATVCIATLVCGCGKKKPIETAPVSKSSGLSGNAKLVADLISGEDLILDLTPRLNKLAKWFQETSAKDSPALPADFKTLTSVKGLLEQELESLFIPDDERPEVVEIATWPLAELSTNPTDSQQNPWAASFDLGATWETMKFGVVSADFTNESQTEFTLHTKVEARGAGRPADNFLAYGMKAHQQIVFSKKGSQWDLTKWIQEDFFVERSRRSLFREVLAEVLPNKESLKQAQRSYKDEVIVNSSKRGEITLPVKDLAVWTNLTSSHIFPSVSVVDYNNDGLDDMFLTARWGPTQMLENQGDGTFVDVAKKTGLLEEYMVNSVLFVDLDNDGDKDAIMGRPMVPAKYLLNENGVFKDVTKTHSDLGQFYFASGISAADVNRDGLLDIYISNYPPLNKVDAQFENRFLNPEEREIYLKKKAKADRWLDLAGSANVLLMNRGNGRLERVPYDEELSQWHRSFQATWADIDNDGDDDVYICNDFAPDALLRNDTPKGAADPVFVDVSRELLIGGELGSAMGGSWGDFDTDGDLDLYVSNMFSKAGTRIIAQVGEVDQRIKTSAAGNFLFENRNGKFEQRAGSGKDKFHINKVGWSYGGQWTDFDNDGRLDLYVPSGFYTAPKEIAAEVDT